MRDRSRNGRRVLCAVIAALAGVMLVASSAVGGATATATAKGKACTGAPAIIETETDLSNTVGGLEVENPSLPAGAEAAAAAVNKTCQLGVPLKIVSCDDAYSPNGATACGAEAVSDKAIAVIGSSCCGDNYAAPVVAAGIPILPDPQVSSVESTSALSYPVGYGIPLLYSELQLERAAGATKVAILALAVPEVSFLTGLLSAQAPKIGLQVAGVISIPVTASDMTSYAGQAISDGANAVITIIGGPQQTALLRDLKELGHPLSAVRGVGALAENLLPAQIPGYVAAKVANGLLAVSWVVSPTTTSNPAVKQYMRELIADHQKHGPLDVDCIGISGWAEVHVVADALKAAHLAPTAANVQTALVTNKLPKLTTHYGLVPINFTRNPFAGVPGLSALRIFTSSSWFYELNKKGVPVLLVNHPVNALAGIPKLKAIK